MVQQGEGILPPVKMGDDVLLDIPIFDRGRGDPPRLIAVVVEEKEGILRVATKHGFLDRWLERNSVHATAHKSLMVEDARTSGSEHSLHELVRMDSVGVGQGYRRCSCRQNCATNRCACRKNNLGCNSACHPGRCCANKK